MRRAGGLALVCIAAAAAGCGKSQPAPTVTVAIAPKAPPPSTTPATTTRARTPAAPPKPAKPAKPARGARPLAAVQPGGRTLAAITDNDEVLVLSDGTVWSLESSERWSPGDGITVAPGGNSLYDANEGERMSATKLGTTASASPNAAEGEHTLETISGDGSLIVLNDASVWAVASADRSTSARWADAATIEVQEGSGGARYRLVNADDHSSVEAGYVANR